MTKRFILYILLSLLICMPALAEAADPQAEIAALNARIAELEATVADLESRLAQYEPAPIDPDADIITFSGGSVKQAEAQAAYDEIAALYAEFGMDKAEYHDIVAEDVLASLAEDAVLMAKAREMQVYESTPEQIAAAEALAREEYESTVAYYLPYFQDDALTVEEVRAAVEQYLAEEGLTYETVLSEMADNLWRDRLYEASTADIAVTDADVRAMYEAGLENARELYADPAMFEYDFATGEIIYCYPEGFREVQYLLLPWNEDELAIEDESLRTDMLTRRCADLFSRADEGADLIALAEEAMLYDYGTLAISTTAGLMPQAFCDAAMALELNSYAPTVGADGVWLIRYTAEIVPGDVPFETLQPVLAESAEEAARLDAYYTMVEQWLAEAGIVTHPEMLR